MAAINTPFVILILSVLAYGTEEIGSDKVLLCSIEFSSYAQDHFGNFTVDGLDPHLCTHIMYNKARIDEINHDIVPQDPSIDLYDNGGQGMYNRTMKLKEENPRLKVILQLCCLGFSFWDNREISHDAMISAFIKNAVTYLERYGFDGLYFSLTSHPEELSLLRGLREEFDKRGFLLLTIIFPVDISPSMELVVTRENSEVFDMVLVLGDYWQRIQKETTILSSLSPLRKIISDANQEGIPFEKMILAIPTFTVSYKLCNANETGISAPICGDGLELTYPQLIYKIRNNSEGWVIQRDNETGILYGHSDSLRWTSFEDTVSIRAKVQHVLEENMAGIGILTVNMDDDIELDEVKLPLTTAAHDALRGN